MGHIKTYFDMLVKILREESDWDLMYYIQSIDTPEIAFSIIKMLDRKIAEMSYNELTREMGKQKFDNKADLLAKFEFIVEKQRGYPLWMWEYSDLEEWAEDWGRNNGYKHLFED